VNVLVVSGIWPPDVGGPASHAPELADFLTERGHAVIVLTTAWTAPGGRAYPVRWTSRRLPPGLRHLRVVAEVARLARGADIVYAASMVTRSALAATLARRPLVAKISGDVAYERARQRGLFAGTLDEFQHARGAGLSALRAARTLAIRRAAAVIFPSEFLARLGRGWGLAPERVHVIPNVIEPPTQLPPRDELRRRLALDGPTLAFAGRLTAAKALEVALEAVAAAPEVTLIVAGDGEERAALERRTAQLGLDGRVRFLGAQSRESVLELLSAADAALLSSSWENFPHVVVEALAVGTPVISTDVGGVAEVIEDGRNGLLVPAQDAAALAAAIRRYFADAELRSRLRDAAASSGAAQSATEVYGRLERILQAAR
jgi:glycosyltransferase involved in cell wall biosynthesis